MKPQQNRTAVFLLAFTLLFASCVKEAALKGATPLQPNMVTKQKPPNKPDTVLQGLGYQARLTYQNKNSDPMTVYYNTTGFTITWEHISVGQWIGVIDRAEEVTDHFVTVGVAPGSHADMVLHSEDNLTNPGIYLWTYKDGILHDKADVWFHADLWTLQNPKPDDEGEDY